MARSFFVFKPAWKALSHEQVKCTKCCDANVTRQEALWPFENEKLGKALKKVLKRKNRRGAL